MARDFKAEMSAIWDDAGHQKLVRAAVDFLRSGDGLHKVNGMERAEVADRLEDLWLHGPKGAYRELLDGNDPRDLDL